MDYESVCHYENQYVKITLLNGFWYRAKILKVSQESVEFLSEDQKTITVTPAAIIMMIPIGGFKR